MTNIYAFDMSLRSTGIAHLSAGLLSLRTVKTSGKGKDAVDLQDAVRVQAHEASSSFAAGEPTTIIMESGALGAIRGKGYEELGALRWLIRDHARHVFGLTVVEISPSHLKKVVTGNGRADKTEVEDAVRDVCVDKFWPQPANNDEADAAGLIITYLKDNGLWRIGGQLQGAEEPGADGTAYSALPF
jgi:crossover junction endodeoxyribonuclease RuvC